MELFCRQRGFGCRRGRALGGGPRLKKGYPVTRREPSPSSDNPGLGRRCRWSGCFPSAWVWLPSRSGAGGRAEVGEGVAGDEKGTVAKQRRPRAWAKV